MFLHGQPYEPRNVDDAHAKGIETVYQDLALIDELSVYHNLFLRRESGSTIRFRCCRTGR